MTRRLLVLLVLAGTGCAGPTFWVKQGVTNAEAERDKAECVSAAYQQFPVAIPQPTQPVVSGPTQINCSTYGSTTNCTSYSSGSFAVQPPDFYQDQNMVPRQAAFRGCMYGRGYVLQSAR